MWQSEEEPQKVSPGTFSFYSVGLSLVCETTVFVWVSEQLTSSVQHVPSSQTYEKC